MDDDHKGEPTENSPESYPFDGPKPWWWDGHINITLESCGCGCLLIPFLFLITSQKDGRLRVELADVMCLITLISVLLAFQTFWAPRLIWVDQVWVALLIGLGCGGILAALRRRAVWLLAGLSGVPLLWFLVEVSRQYAKLLAL